MKTELNLVKLSRYFLISLLLIFSGKQITGQVRIIEKDWIELAVTPEVGGKLYYATDKTNNYNFIYKYDKVKPSNIGMTGAWVSGGIEWCVMHHLRPSTYIPVDYTTTENEDGIKTIEVGVIFGAPEVENTRISQAYTIRGSGHKRLGNLDQAKLTFSTS